MVRCTTGCYAVLNSKGIDPSWRVAQAEFPGNSEKNRELQAPPPLGRRIDARKRKESSTLRANSRCNRNREFIWSNREFKSRESPKTGNLRRFAAGRSQALIPPNQI